jgi:DNA-damage-inducible protein J
MGNLSMNKSSRIEARIDTDLKQSAETIFAQLGISPSEAIRIFYKQVTIHNGLPFDIRIPNAETLAAIDETENHPERLIRHKSAEAMFEAWQADDEAC